MTSRETSVLGRGMRRAIWACTAILVLADSSAAQAVRLERIASGARITSDVGVELLVLAYSSSTRTFSTHRVPARGTATTTGTVLLTIEPLSVTVGRRAMYRACTSNASPSQRAVLQQTIAELKKIELLETAESQARIEAASTIAYLELAQRQDERQTFRNDALRTELARQQRAYESQQRAVGAYMPQSAFADAMTDIADAAFAWSQVQQEKLAVLRDQVTTFEPIVAQARLAYRIRTEELAAYNNEISAWHGFSATAVSTLDGLMGGRLQVLDAPAFSRMTKLCPGPSGQSDIVVISGPRADTGAALIVEATFDGGVKQSAVFRRLSNGSDWTGRIDWPADAGRARLRMRWPGTKKWTAVNGALHAERDSMSASAREAKDALRQIERKMDESNFRAAGGDHIRTIPVF